MANKGQIVEIPASSTIYQEPSLGFSTKKEQLSWYANDPKYSLFDGILIGGHDGIDNFKIGQRKGVNQHGGAKESLYVIAIDPKTNRIFAGAGRQHPGLYKKVIQRANDDLVWNTRSTLHADDIVDILFSKEDTHFPAKLYLFEDSFFIEFLNPIEKTSIDQNFKILKQGQTIAHTHQK